MYDTPNPNWDAGKYSALVDESIKWLNMAHVYRMHFKRCLNNANNSRTCWNELGATRSEIATDWAHWMEQARDHRRNYTRLMNKCIKCMRDAAKVGKYL